MGVSWNANSANGPDTPVMIRLRTLGPAQIEGLDPRRAAPLLAQPKRWALAVFLSIEATDASVPRDRVLGTFWPERTTRRARGSLRNALHHLRAVLGGDSVRSIGDGLQAASERVVSDAWQLLHGAGPSDHLLELWRGDLLEGVHVGPPEFEHWLDRTRHALRARAAELAWSRADRARDQGQWITAAAFGRRAVEFSVDVEAASRRLIRLLDGAGDRAAALAEYDRLTGALQSTYGVGPSPETDELVRSLRERTDVRADWDAEAAPAPVRETPSHPSLAVLPFRGLGEADADRLALGATDDLVTALAALPEVRVLSRTSIQAFAESPPASMADVRERLGVDLVVEGSVRQVGRRVRVNARLVDTVSEAQRWAATYDRPQGELFDIQSDVALAIARTLEVGLSPRVHRRLRSPPTRSVDAYDRYLRARHLWTRRTLSGVTAAMGLLEEAVRMDPEFVLGWVGLADAHLIHAALTEDGYGEHVNQVRRLVDHALSLDPDSGEARATLGTLTLFIDADPKRALREYRRAVTASPGYVTARHWYGNLLVVDGETARGFDELDIALDLDPLSALVHENVGLARFHVGDTEAALRHFDQALLLEPAYWRAHWAAGLCLAFAGRLGEAVSRMIEAWSMGAHGMTVESGAAIRRCFAEKGAEAALDTALELGPRHRPPHRGWSVVEGALLATLGRFDDAVDALERARGEGTLPFLLLCAPTFDALSHRPRFTELLAGLGYVPRRWRTHG